MSGIVRRTLVMGILNVTPDSFSDGGRWADPEAAIRHGRELLAEGADIIDVGGESTRPGAQRVSQAEELDRILPVITELTRLGAAISVDTMRAGVAVAALEAGASIVNDVSGGLADPDMYAAVAPTGCRYIAMHWRGQSDRMQDLASYGDVVTDVRSELAARVDAALATGIAPESLVIDPGLGFAKNPEHNWELLRRLDELQNLGLPVLIGASRKRFLGELLAVDGVQRPPRGRDAATAALTAWLASRGVWGVRTHTVREHLDAIAVASRLAANGTESGVGYPPVGGE